MSQSRSPHSKIRDLIGCNSRHLVCAAKWRRNRESDHTAGDITVCVCVCEGEEDNSRKETKNKREEEERTNERKLREEREKKDREQEIKYSRVSMCVLEDKSLGLIKGAE